MSEREEGMSRRGEKLGEKKAARAGTKDRGQRARMYGHGLGNLSERVRN